jgi:hypothetical protein
MSGTAPKSTPQPDRGHPRAGAAIFKIGNAVTSSAKPAWRGEVVDVSRLQSGYVTVRWRTPAGTAVQSMEERVDFLVLLPPLVGPEPR